MTQQWDTGYLIGMIITGVFTAAGLVTFAIALVTWLRRDDDYGISGLAAVIGAAVAVFAFAFLAFIAWPLDGQYHRFQPLGGQVTKIGSRFLASDTQNGGTTQKFVLTFTSGLSLGCLDTRCANVSVGDNVLLLCERVYQFNAPSPGWDCNWGSDRKPDGTVIP